jgi:hypothetical protein
MEETVFRRACGDKAATPDQFSAETDSMKPIGCALLAMPGRGFLHRCLHYRRRAPGTFNLVGEAGEDVSASPAELAR